MYVDNSKDSLKKLSIHDENKSKINLKKKKVLAPKSLCYYKEKK